ncbi:Squamous cell carcinoma antigen recognized by T-cells 3 [Haplosporangium sp. Z 27]|nr:Squamous cell carcinoma antigen recognized by T-cells 3 [Haplosporangium sp. Z 27]
MGNKDEFSDSEDDFEMERTGGSKETTSPETLELISTVKKSLEENPRIYEQHIQLIALLKNAEMLQELREARESMSKQFPLSEELWMDWIEDESNMATSEDEKKHVLELYERATSDYLSIKIWKSYLDYAIQEYTESMEFPENEIVVSEEYLKSLFHKADKFTGYHTSQSHIVWNVRMDFELGQLASKDTATSEDVKRVKAMYLDRISIAHSELESTFSGLSSFISKYDGQDYEESMVRSNKIASATRSLLAKLEPFEEQLVATNNSLEAFTNYIDYEQRHHKDQFAQIRTLFERAVAVHCLVPSLWNDYLSFLMSSSHQKKAHDLDPAEMLSVATRSVRNCPWSGDLWENQLILLETYLKPEDEVTDTLARALNELVSVPSPLELTKVLLANCSYKFRRANMDEGGHKEVRAAFEHAVAVVEAAGGDPYCRLERLWIELESTSMGDHEQARKLWNSIESKQRSMSDFWIARADMERKLNNIKGARQIFVRACNSAESLDWPEKVFDSWLLFERQYGTLSIYRDSLIRIRTALKTVEAFRSQGIQQAYDTQAAYDVAQPSEGASTVVTDVPKEPSKKRKLSAQDETNVSKISKTHDDQSISTKSQNANKDKSKPLSIGAGHHDDTCFYGTILRCTIPKSRSEGKRLFAYVQFSSSDEANAALALHGRDVGDRRGLSVQISDTTQKKARGTGKPPLLSGFECRLPLVSRHEVHISGLTNEIKEEELQKLIALIAEPTEVFIKRGGELWANIKFKSEEDANAALTLNGTMFQSKELVVTRRVFSNSESASDASPSRAVRRKNAAKARALADQESKIQVVGEGGDVAAPENTTMLSTLSESDEVKKDEKNSSTLAPSTSNEFREPLAPQPQMRPRSMQPRNLQPRVLTARQSHAFPPKRAFKPASVTTVLRKGEDGSQKEDEQSGSDGAVSSSTSTATAPAAAPKSNADFRALMLSGALKKKNA